MLIAVRGCGTDAVLPCGRRAFDDARVKGLGERFSDPDGQVEHDLRWPPYDAPASATLTAQFIQFLGECVVVGTECLHDLPDGG